MKKILLLLLLVSFSLSAQQAEKTCITVSKIYRLIQQEHYSPKPLDDSLSVYVFDTFIDGLDPNRNILTKADYEKLVKYRLLIDDYITDGSCDFIDDFTDTYKFALQRKKSTLEKLQQVPFDYTTKDTVKFSRESFPFDLKEADIEKVWNKRLRFEVLEDIAKYSKNKDSLQLHFAELEKKSRAKIFENNLCKASSMLEGKKGLENTLHNSFLDIFCNYFDPHSNYFSVDARSSFVSALSTSNLSLGLTMGLNENEEITIGEIIPGGPASQNGQFEKGDVIVKVDNKKGDEYWVSCTSLDAISEIIFSDLNIEIQLTIRKKNGKILDVDLVKQVMKANENSVYSYIAEKDGSRVGYIKIPNFYSDFDSNTEIGCADDVAKEIVKLQDDKIDGLVIDLEDNGGGSMQEAIKLAGMFIDSGAVSVLQDSRKRQEIVKDPKRGAVYYGPVVLLINGNSASASEFFSAALQDYKRAVVIGSTSLGKASMQTIVPIDDKNEDDFIKITIQKFYRITGDSNQIKGIIPDVPLPVLFDSLIPREKNYKTALKYDSIASKAKYRPYPVPEWDRMVQMSRDRTQNSSTFLELKKLNIGINKAYNRQRKPVRLTFDDVFIDAHEVDSLWKEVKEVSEKPTAAIITATSWQNEKMKSDKFEQDISAFKIKEVKTNPYLEEAIAIIKDYGILRQAVIKP